MTSTKVQAAATKLVALLGDIEAAPVEQGAKIRAAIALREHVQATKIAPLGLADFYIVTAALETAGAMAAVAHGPDAPESLAVPLTRAVLHSYGYGELSRAVGYDPESELHFSLIQEDKNTSLSRLLRDSYTIEK